MTKKEIVPAILAILMMTVLCSCGEEEASAVNTADTDAVIAVDNEVYTGNGTAWCSSLFEKPSTIYNNSLAFNSSNTHIFGRKNVFIFFYMLCYPNLRFQTVVICKNDAVAHPEVLLQQTSVILPYIPSNCPIKW